MLAHLTKELSFQSSPSLGFVTADPQRLGTALTTTCKLKIPHAGTSPELSSICSQHNVASRTVQDESSDAANVVFEISSKRTLGVSGLESIDDVLVTVDELLRLDQKLAEDEAQRPASGPTKTVRSMNEQFEMVCYFIDAFLAAVSTNVATDELQLLTDDFFYDSAFGMGKVQT